MEIKKVIRKNTVYSIGFIIVGLIIFNSAILWSFFEYLDVWKEKDLTYIDSAEWALLSSTLISKLDKAKYDGLSLQEKVYTYLGDDYLCDSKKVAYDLDHLFNHNNIIRTAVIESLKGYYFDDIVSFNTDPFAIYGDIFISDDSGDCASLGKLRTFEEEYGGHANPEMAEKNTFYRISIGDSGTINKPLFFQFDNHPEGIKIKKNYGIRYKEHNNKKAWILDTNDLAGLKKSFYDCHNWRKVFLAFEFVTPTYLFDKSDLAGRSYIQEGLRTDIKRLSIQTTFNFKNVIDHMPELRSELAKFSERRIEVMRWFEVTQITLLFILIINLILGIFSIVYIENVTRNNYGLQ